MSGASIEVAAVLAIAALVRSALGFGEALIAVPLLALMMPIEVATPIATLVSITIAAAVLVQDWSHVQARSAGRLVVATLAGIPLGLLLLTRVAEPIVKGALGCVILAFSIHALASKRRASLDDDRFAWAFGFAAGVLGGAYGMNGPPLVVFGALRGWSPQRFRATLQGYFLPASVAGMAGYALAGLWTPAVTHHYLASLPGVLVAVLVGRAVNRRLRARGFLVAVHVALAAIAVLLLAQALQR